MHWQVILVFPAAIIVIVLQVFLSKGESKWTGLALPAVAFIISFFYPLNMAVSSEGVDGEFIIQEISIWLLGNIPTIVLLAIYFGFQIKKNRSKQLAKMNIQDLD